MFRRFASSSLFFSSFQLFFNPLFAILENLGNHARVLTLDIHNSDVQAMITPMETHNNNR